MKFGLKKTKVNIFWHCKKVAEKEIHKACLISGKAAATSYKIYTSAHSLMWQRKEKNYFCHDPFFIFFYFNKSFKISS